MNIFVLSDKAKQDVGDHILHSMQAKTAKAVGYWNKFNCEKYRGSLYNGFVVILAFETEPVEQFAKLGYKIHVEIGMHALQEQIISNLDKDDKHLADFVLVTTYAPLDGAFSTMYYVPGLEYRLEEILEEQEKIFQ